MALDEAEQPAVASLLDEAEQRDIARLLVELEAGLRMMKRAFDRAVDGPGERRALMIGLLALSQHAAIIAPEEALDVPINRSINHLAALDDGFVAPMLAPIKKKGRSSSVDDQEVRGRVAGALELYFRAGMPPGEAADRIVRKLQKAGYLVGRSGVLGWRKAVREGRSTELMRERYKAMLAGNTDTKDFRAAAEHVIKTVCERHPRRKKR
jgi:hypothetical protein